MSEEVLNNPEELGEKQVVRDDKGRFVPGVSGNPTGEGAGRPKNSLKDYIKRKLSKMSDEEKEQWLIDNNISEELQFRMAEGNPHQTSDITSDDKPIQIYGGVSQHSSNEKDIQSNKEDKSS